MKRHLALMPVAALLACLGTHSAQAEIISANIRQYPNDLNDIDTDETYGVAAESSVTGGWLNGGSGAFGALTLADGSPTTVTTTATNPGGTQTVFSTSLDDTALRAGIASYSPTAASFPSITFLGLSGTFTSYDIIVYLTGNDGADQGQVSDGSTTYFFSPVGGNGTPGSALTQTTDTNSGDGIDEANYAVFSGLSADSVTIEVRSIDSASGNSGTFVGIGGFQIVGTLVPEPSSLALLGLGGLLIARRRRG